MSQASKKPVNHLPKKPDFHGRLKSLTTAPAPPCREQLHLNSEEILGDSKHREFRKI